MNKAEYKKLSHDIRTMCRNLAEMHTEMYGNDVYKYRCYGDVEIGLIWEKRWKFI